jgi:hypothetical protein
MKHAPVIHEWSSADGSHLAGRVYGHLSYEDGTAITTSPITLVQLTGRERRPIAHTRSGSAYCLGVPAESFGQANAEAFVNEKLEGQSAPAEEDAKLMTTAILRRDPSES